MKLLKSFSLVAVSFVLVAFSSSSFASYYYYSKYKKTNEVEITVTNLTYNQVFAPILGVSHFRTIQLFTAGEPASEGIALMAEAGDVSGIVDAVSGSDLVGATADSGGPLMPGKSVTFTLPSERFERLSLVSMLVNTNDAFLALDTVYVPRRKGQSLTYFAKAYDAGSEINDELCANIPGPACGGEGASAADGEGFVHIHRGIHGVGDLAAATYDWRNPVAKITITRK